MLSVAVREQCVSFMLCIWSHARPVGPIQYLQKGVKTLCEADQESLITRAYKFKLNERKLHRYTSIRAVLPLPTTTQ